MSHQKNIVQIDFSTVVSTVVKKKKNHIFSFEVNYQKKTSTLFKIGYLNFESFIIKNKCLDTEKLLTDRKILTSGIYDHVCF